MPDSRILAIVLLILLCVVATAQTSERRVAGPVRLEGSPERPADHGFEVAFPRLRFNRPLWIGHAGDGTDRLFVLEQGGRVHVFENRPDVATTSIVLDLSSRVYRGHNEEGLLGMAFHPDVVRNKMVFLHYSSRGGRSGRRGIVARFKMNGALTTIRPRSEKLVLQQPQPWGNHNGGCLVFGPDGYLYLTFGDGGAANDPKRAGQDLGTWLGKILRIDVDGRGTYSVPKDNPFVGRRGARGEIWAWGLRNVWRMSFDRVTGRLWAGDVGQGRWEEIDIIERGGNYGWSAREGAHPFRGTRGTPPFIDPVIEHGRGEAASITGGYVYRGKRLPGLWGAYLYADYATGWVWAARFDGERITEHHRLGRAGAVSSFGEDRDGEVLFTNFDGRIYRFVERGKGISGVFPTRLSETGLFVDTSTMKPHPSLIAYDVNVPLWSAGAAKRRWLHLPGLEKITVKVDGSFTFPGGTIFVKTFFEPGSRDDRHRLETRLLVKGKRGWAGYTYVWNDDMTDASLIDGRHTRAIGTTARPEHWTFPSRGDCMKCHTDAGGHVLGFRMEQIDRGDQIARFEKLGLFDGKLPEREPFPAWEPADTKDRAVADRLVRAYLDANCAMCHQPGGQGNATIDLRYTTPLERTGLVGGAPGQGDLGVTGAKIVSPGAPKRSVLWLRMNRTDEKAMPPIGGEAPDKKASRRIADWIRRLDRK